MIHLSDHNQSVVALIYNNILLIPDGKVIGVLLGHCVFGIDGQVKARYFKHNLFTMEGKILAKDGESDERFAIDIPQLVENAWILLMKIKDHTCPTVVPGDDWATTSVSEHFSTIVPSRSG
jgi:hypothetical protein